MARTPRRLYLPLDVEFFENARVLDAGEAAALLYLSMACRAKRLETDGILTRLQIERLAVKNWDKRLDALVRHGLVALTDEGTYLIVGWLERNLSAAEIAEHRRKDSARKRTGRLDGFQTESARIPDGVHTDSGAQEEEKRREVEVEPGTLRSVRGGRR